MEFERAQAGRVVAFRNAPARGPATGTGPRLNVAERIDVLRWADAASPFGVRRVQIHDPEPGDDPATSPFLLVYGDGDLWAAWGVARQHAGYELWRPGTGRTVGCFPSMRSALAAIVDVA